MPDIGEVFSLAIFLCRNNCSIPDQSPQIVEYSSAYCCGNTKAIKKVIKAHVVFRGKQMQERFSA